MKLNPIVNSGLSQTNFKAVNQEYLKWAEDLNKNGKSITFEWVESLADDVILFENISKKDAVDTMTAVKKYVGESSKKFYNNLLNYLNKG